MSERDDLNNQGNYTSGAIGPDGKGILVGTGLTQNIQNLTLEPPPPPPPGYYPSGHPVREYTFNDVIAVLIGDAGDPLTGRPARVGIISQLSVMDAHLNSIDNQQAAAHTERLALMSDVRDVKLNQYPRAFQMLMMAMASAIIVLLLAFVILLVMSRINGA